MYTPPDSPRQLFNLIFHDKVHRLHLILKGQEAHLTFRSNKDDAPQRIHFPDLHGKLNTVHRSLNADIQKIKPSLHRMPLQICQQRLRVHACICKTPLVFGRL